MRNSVVAVVVDRRFGDRLNSLASRLPVWIGTSVKNRTAVDHVRAQHPDYDITSINAGADYSDLSSALDDFGSGSIDI